MIGVYFNFPRLIKNVFQANQVQYMITFIQIASIKHSSVDTKRLKLVKVILHMQLHSHFIYFQVSCVVPYCSCINLYNYWTVVLAQLGNQLTGYRRCNSDCDTRYNKQHMRRANKQTADCRIKRSRRESSSCHHDTYCIVLHTSTCRLTASKSLYFPAVCPATEYRGRRLLTVDSTSPFKMDCFCEITSLSWLAISLGEK